MPSPGRHDISRNLIRIWVRKFEAERSMMTLRPLISSQDYEAKIAALERLVGRQALEIEFLKGALKSATAAEARVHPSSPAPVASPSSEGCRLMGLSRSTYCDVAHCGLTTPR